LPIQFELIAQTEHVESAKLSLGLPTAHTCPLAHPGSVSPDFQLGRS
jgi:hypothetical protein